MPIRYNSKLVKELVGIKFHRWVSAVAAVKIAFKASVANRDIAVSVSNPCPAQIDETTDAVLIREDIG